VPDEVVDVNLTKGAQREPAYRAVNPMMALPALIDGEGPILFESLAIIEYLDETHPNPPLLPRDARGRARVRGLAQIVACDSHPLIVPACVNIWNTNSSSMNRPASNGASIGTPPR
jgi:maleylacetoacetate isomerase